MQDELPVHSPPSNLLSTFVVGTMLAVVVGLVYGNCFSRELVFDSATIVRDDPRIHELTGENLRAIFSQNYWWPNMPSSLYRPLTTLSYLFNCTILGNGEDPRGYQAVNLCLHLLAAALVFALGCRLGLKRLSASIAAGVFAVHPVATDSVVNIVGRADLLATVFVLGATILAWDARRDEWTIPAFCGFSALAFAGILAKESATALVPIIVLVGLVPMRGSIPLESRPKAASARWWVVAGTILISIAVTFFFAHWWFRFINPGSDDPFVDNPIAGVAWWPGRLTALRVLWDEAVSLAAPYTLSADYSYAEIPVATGGWSNSSDRLGWLVLAGVVVVAAILIVRLRRGYTPAGFAWMAAFAAAIPTSNLIVTIGSIRADRFLYLPLSFVVIGASFWLEKATGVAARRPALKRVRNMVAALLFVWVGALAVLAHVRTYEWRDNLSLWEATVRAVPSSYKAHQNLGVALLNQSETTRPQIVRAIAELEKARDILSQPPLPAQHQVGRVHAALGTAYGKLAALELSEGNAARATTLSEEAERSLREGVAITEAVRTAYILSLRKRGIPEARIPTPYGEQPTRALASFLVERGRATEAVEALNGLLKINPTDTAVRVQAADAADRAGNVQAALDHALWAIILGTHDPQAVQIAAISLRKFAPADEEKDVLVLKEERQTLNLANPFVRQCARAALLEVRDHFAQLGDPLRTSRLERLAKFGFGVELPR